MVLKPGEKIEVEEIMDFIRKRLAKFKVPKQIVLMDQLPRNAAGKVLKNLLYQKHF